MNNFYRQDVCEDHMILWNTNIASRNALSPSYYEGLMKGLKQASESPNVCAVILAGEGDFFCSGGDLNTLQKRRDMNLDERHMQIDKLHNIIRAIRGCPKPVIAAVEGGAAGAGLSLVTACDMVVSATSAKFVLAYVKAGLVPDGGVTRALAEALPRATVSKMAMLGHPISAERLYELGMITEIVAPGKALEAAQNLAREIATGPETAITTIKMLLERAQYATLDEQLDEERNAMAGALGGDEARIGISAFLNKQRPVFR